MNYYLSKKVLISPSPKRPLINFDQYVDLVALIKQVSLTQAATVDYAIQISPASTDLIGQVGGVARAAREDHKHPAQLPSAFPDNLIITAPDGLHFLNSVALISTDANNTLVEGTDGKLFVPPGGGGGGALAVLNYNNITGILTLLDGAGGSYPIDITATNLVFTPTGNTTSSTVQDAIVELQTEIDNITPAISTITDLGNGVYRHFDGVANLFDIDTRAASNPYSNTISGLAATDVQAAIDELSTNIHPAVTIGIGSNPAWIIDTVSQVSRLDLTQPGSVNWITGFPTDNIEGYFQLIETYLNNISNQTGISLTDTSYVSFPGNIISDGANIQLALEELEDYIETFQLAVSTITDVGNGLYEHNDGLGTITNIDTRAISNFFDNTVLNALVSTDVQGAIDELTKCCIDLGGSTNGALTLVDNGSNNGRILNLDLTTPGSYENTISGLTSTDIQGAIDELATTSGLSTISHNALTGIISHNNGKGTITDVTITASTVPYIPTLPLTAINVQDAIEELEVLISSTSSLSVVTDNNDGTYTHDDGTGNTTVIDIINNSATSSVSFIPTTGIFTHEDGVGGTQTIIFNAFNTPVTAIPGLVGTNVQEVLEELATSSHDPVTLNGIADPRLTLVGQQLNLDLSNLNNVITLTGVATDSTDLGTFTGSTIPDNVTIKDALQSLESKPTPIGLQEFLNNELILDRTGETCFVVPDYMAGHSINQFRWSIFTPDTGTFDFDLFVGAPGAAVSVSTVNVLSSAVTGVASPGTTLAAGDIVYIVTSNTAGAPPAGLTVTLEIVE